MVLPTPTQRPILMWLPDAQTMCLFLLIVDVDIAHVCVYSRRQTTKEEIRLEEKDMHASEQT